MRVRTLNPPSATKISEEGKKISKQAQNPQITQFKIYVVCNN